MGWEKDGRYYTRSSRVNGRVVREYVGSGELSLLSARLDAILRAERRAERERDKQQCQALQSEDEELRAYCQAVETVLRDALTGAGYHQHARGEWRKRRGAQRMDRQKMDRQKALQEEKARRVLGVKQIQSATTGKTGMTGKAAKPLIPPAKPLIPEDKEEQWQIVKAAIKEVGSAQEEQALAIVRAYPKEFPFGWGDPTNNLVEQVGYPSRPVLQEIIKNEYAAKVREVAGAAPTLLETLLAERVVVCRMQITHYERDYTARLTSSSAAGEGLSLTLSDHCQTRLDRLHKRYLSAIKTLAQVRRLQLPMQVQVNIAEKQVNIAAQTVS